MAKYGSSKAPVTVQFTGTENINQIFEKLPAKYAKKPVLATMRKAARVFTKDLKASTPRLTGETRKAIGVKAGRGTVMAVGFRTSGSYMPAWFKAYWKNYGTLSNRDTSHKFVKPRKAVSSSWGGGIRATGFVEESWDRTKQQVQQTIERELSTETRKFLEKYAVK